MSRKSLFKIVSVIMLVALIAGCNSATPTPMGFGNTPTPAPAAPAATTAPAAVRAGDHG
ncbi:MAG: hypothetical protein NT169_19805 [Chloroflexi bacterium]|nr:hypothetical protein [Chloroflexota bacterium]